MKIADVRKATELVRFLDDLEDLQAGIDHNKTYRLQLVLTDSDEGCVMENYEMSQQLLYLMKRRVQTELVETLGVEI